MNIKAKRMASILLAALILMVNLTGCQKDGTIVSNPQSSESGSGKNVPMGRYVENEIKLPDGITMKSTVNMWKDSDGKIVLLTKNVSQNKAEFSSYQLSGSSWNQKPLTWLNDLKLDSEGLSIYITRGGDNNFYALYRNSLDEQKTPKTFLIKSTDEKTTKYIDIPALDEAGDFGYTHAPQSMIVLKNGNILMPEYTVAYLYDQKSGKEISKTTNNGNGDIHLTSSKDIFYQYNAQESQVEQYDGASGEKSVSYPIAIKESYNLNMAIDNKNTLMLLSSDGLNCKKDGSDIWELLIDGSLNTLSSPRFFAANFLPGDSDDFYVLFFSMDEAIKLIQYTYNPNISAAPETTLTVFSLNENSTIKQAANDFQAKNPNVKVEIQATGSEDTSAVRNDYIRAFNTELLAGNGPDLIVLDGLPIQSYIDKGVLSDISGVVKTLIQDGEFLPNLEASCTQDGKIYAIPTKIGLPMAFGDKTLTSLAGDPQKLSAYISENAGKNLFGTLDRTKFLETYLSILKSDLFDDQGFIIPDKLSSFLEIIKTILDSAEIADPSNDVYPSSDWAMLRDGNPLYISVISGFFNSESAFSVIKQSGGSAASLSETFVPYGKVGINRNSKNNELATQFLQSILAVDNQNVDHYDGFPVNPRSLDHFLDIELSVGEAYGGSFTGFDGKTYETAIKWPDKEQRREIIRICKEVNQEASLDSTILEMILSETNDYFDNKKSLELTVEAVRIKTETYQAE